jgi:hypothetical protein
MTMTGEAFALTCACDWLRTLADAAAKGEVTLESGNVRWALSHIRR